MNRGTYGFSLPPNYATRVAPPRWTNARAYTVAGTYTGFIVPANVFQIGIMVAGAGGSGAMSYNTGYVATGGGGGGFAFGILDVVPGQVLPTITVGAGGASLNTTTGNGNAGGTSSFGNIVTCTGGSGGATSASNTSGTGGAGGTATVTGLRGSTASTGGRGGSITTSGGGNYKATGGGAPGGFFASANGGDLIAAAGANLDVHATGGAGWGGNGSGVNTSTTATGCSSYAYGGGAFNLNGLSVIAQNSVTPLVTSGTGTATVGFINPNSGVMLGGSGIIGTTAATVANGTGALLQAAAGSGFPNPNESNPYLLLANLNFGGAGGNSYMQGSGTANTYCAGSGGLGGGGGAAFNSAATGNANVFAGNGGMTGGGGGFGANGTCGWTKAGDGGFFGGGGAHVANTTTINAYAGNGGNGGGGGGIAVATNTVRVSGAGGDGAVILYWTEGY